MKRAFFLATLFLTGCGPNTAGRTGASNGGFYLDLSVPSDLSDTGDLTPEKPDACAAVTAMATLQKKPVDIIVVIDDSGSMSDELDGVEKNITVNFSNILATSGLDYRGIMFSEWGTGTYHICVK